MVSWHRSCYPSSDMKRNRSTNFVIAIVLGILVGLAVGWLLIKLHPAYDADITRLRPDFRTDAVLMVAEHFAVTGDKILALDQLARLNHGNLLTFVGKAVTEAERLNYSVEDKTLILNLLEGLDLVVYENWQVLRGRND